MYRKKAFQLIIAAVIIVGLIITTNRFLEQKEESELTAKDESVMVKQQEDSKQSLVILSYEAAKRIGIKTENVRDEAGQKVIPYSAVIYEPDGSTWAYTNPKSLTFVRERIVVDRIDGAQTILSDGPSVGTAVVTVGAAELFGAETGVGD